MIKEVLLIDICKPKQWKTISSSELLSYGYPVYGANGKIGYYSKYTHEFPTVLVTCRGATCGRVNISEPKSYVNGNAMALDDLDSSVDLKYLYHVLCHRGFNDVISGSAQPQITRQNLKTLKIPFLPLAEQKQIAAILDAADSLRQKDQKLVEHYTALSQSLFLEMFGDPVTNPKKWNTKYFSDVFTTKTGKLDSNAASDTGIYPFFTCAKQPLKIDSYTYDEEALLLAGNNAAGIFDVKYYNGKFDAYQRTYILTIKGNELTYSFVKVALEKKLADLERLSIGSSTQYLTMQILKRLEFSVPPIQLQNQFAERIAIIGQQKKQAQTNLQKSEALFNSLLQRAFTGELTADKAA